MNPSKNDIERVLSIFGVNIPGGRILISSPVDGMDIGGLTPAGMPEVADIAQRSQMAFAQWRIIPAPRRGELVRRFGEALRARKTELGLLVTLDCGKPLSEGLGEVQEMIDICDFAVGLSRQLHGLTIASERPGHRMSETWHPLGPVAIITAFNFPVAVWAWNAALALVCGNSVVWKPSEKTPLTALAVQALFDRVAREFGPDAPEGLAQLVLGDATTGAALVDDPGMALISATGSTAMGRTVGQAAAKRFARSLLELGGNNATIVAPSADMELALTGCAFGFMGTTGQRCTSLRRLLVHRSVYDSFVPRIISAAARLPIGDPRDPANLAGPLIDGAAYATMRDALADARALGATIHGGERIAGPGQGVYVRPAVVEMPSQTGPMLRETFAPIVYCLRYDELDEAIALNNAATQGLSSSIFTNDLREAEAFVAAAGSDCGIANVNIGTSGAEIGGAFGGEKETGGGRESGSDSWKAYMRRQTSTVNYSRALPLAQGVRFEL